MTAKKPGAVPGGWEPGRLPVRRYRERVGAFKPAIRKRGRCARLTITLPYDLAVAIRRLAKDTDTNMSALLARAAARELVKYGYVP